ncbi:hypothetical protein ACFQBU_01390 [Jhaorihella thermophila]
MRGFETLIWVKKSICQSTFDATAGRRQKTDGINVMETGAKRAPTFQETREQIEKPAPLPSALAGAGTDDFGPSMTEHRDHRTESARTI